MTVGWDEVAAAHPLMGKSVDPDWWKSYFTANPKVMYKLLSDLHGISVQYRQGDPNRLPTLDDLKSLVTHQYSNDAFGEALKQILGTRSVRWLASRVSVDHSLIARYIRGDRDIVSVNDPRGSMDRIEAIARELRVHPSYFSEWRRLWIMSLVDDMFAEKPNLSIGVYRRFTEQTGENARSRSQNTDQRDGEMAS